MAKGKLITVCQSGGKFTSSNDGSLSYTGGDAHAFHRRIADFSYVGKWVGLIVKVAQPHSSSCQFLRSTGNISSDFHHQLSLSKFCNPILQISFAEINQYLLLSIKYLLLCCIRLKRESSRIRISPIRSKHT